MKSKQRYHEARMNFEKNTDPETIEIIQNIEEQKLEKAYRRAEIGREESL